MTESRPTCSHARRDGSPCRAPALPGKTVCTFHDPDLAKRRAAGRRRGGETTRSRHAAAVLPGAPEVIFKSMADVSALLATTATQVRRGEVDCKVGNCLAYIAATAMKAIQQSDLETRMARIEERLSAMNTVKGG
jgi:hypothetical protein